MEERTRLKNVGFFFWYVNECKVICKLVGLGLVVLVGRMRYYFVLCWFFRF